MIEEPAMRSIPLSVVSRNTGAILVLNLKGQYEKRQMWDSCSLEGIRIMSHRLKSQALGPDCNHDAGCSHRDGQLQRNQT